MNSATTTDIHHDAARSHLERRDEILREVRSFDFRTIHLEPHFSRRNALIAEAEIAHGMALACAGEGRCALGEWLEAER